MTLIIHIRQPKSIHMFCRKEVGNLDPKQERWVLIETRQPATCSACIDALKNHLYRAI